MVLHISSNTESIYINSDLTVFLKLDQKQGATVMRICCGLLAVLVFSLSVAGCAFSERIEKNRAAKQIELQPLYHKTLVQKYSIPSKEGTLDLLKIVEKDEELAAQRFSKAAALRADGEKVLKRLAEERSTVLAEIERQKKKLMYMNGDIKKNNTAILVLEKKLTAKPADSDLERRLGKEISSQEELAVDKAILEEEIRTLEKRNMDLASSVDSQRKVDYHFQADQERRELRNAVIYDFMAMADFYYYKFKNDLLASRAYGETGFDLSELALSTAATLTGGLTSKTNLSAASTLLKGSRSSIDKNLFVEQTISTIVTGIEIRREEDRVAILGKMEESTDDYPISLALSDIERYQSHASLISGAVIVANETSKRAVELRQR